MASAASSSPSAMEIDSNTALDLVKKGASLLLLDVPHFTLLGIDTQIFSVGPKFKGIKMIPPGSHFLYYSSSNKEGNEFSPIIGFFITLLPSQVVVRRWHQKDERLIKLSEDEEPRYSEAVKRLEFDSHLGPYQLDRYSEWNQLSNFLSEDIIKRLEPIGGEITIMQEAELLESKGAQTEMEKRLMDQLRGAKCSSIGASKGRERENKGCYYTSIPHFVRNKHVSGDELTALNIDKALVSNHSQFTINRSITAKITKFGYNVMEQAQTKLLETILNRDYGGQEDLLLGELQFSFIAFMMGQSLEAFYQWKSIVSLLLSCIEAPLHTRTRLFAKFVKVIYHQIKHGFRKERNGDSGGGMGSSFFLDEGWFCKDVFLYHLCKDFFPVVLEAHAVDGDLLLWSRKLKKLLETSLGWDFDDNALMAEADDDDEFAPVVVQLEEETQSSNF